MSDPGVLVLDPVPEQAESIGRSIRNSLYTVYTSVNSIEAIDIISSRSVQVFVVNAGVCGFSGTCFFDLVKNSNPGISIIAYGDSSSSEAHHMDLNMRGVELVTDPEDLPALKRKIDQAVISVKTLKTEAVYGQIIERFRFEFPNISGGSGFRAYSN